VLPSLVFATTAISRSILLDNQVLKDANQLLNVLDGECGKQPGRDLANQGTHFMPVLRPPFCA
jgi:hypothetical protein